MTVFQWNTTQHLKMNLYHYGEVKYSIGNIFSNIVILCMVPYWGDHFISYVSI